MDLHRKLFLVCFSFFLVVMAGIPNSALASEHALKIKIIHATKKGDVVDPEIKKLAGDFSQLKFTSFRVLDKAEIKVTVGGSSKFQLPNGLWMTVLLKEIAQDGALRLQIEAAKLKFKSRIGIKQGGTVAVGGPSFKEGALIFALSRAKAPKQ